jgi:hypothetical protein
MPFCGSRFEVLTWIMQTIKFHPYRTVMEPYAVYARQRTYPGIDSLYKVGSV